MGAQDKKLANKVPTSIKRNVPKLRFLWGNTQFLIGKSSLHKMGWFKSAWTESSVDRDGNPIPWITYPAIYFINNRITKKMTVFEYGSGNSTLFWAEKGKSVTAVESDKFWQEKLQKTAPKNASIIYRELGKEYSNAIKDQKGSFDIVVVDGRLRVDCAKASVSKLSAGGVIVWDNTDRERYQQGMKELGSKGFKRIDFYGPMPIDNMISLTTIFYRKDNVLGI
jgi:hypothetical protein